MLEPKNNDELPAIPGKRYFTIGEVSELCGVKPHVLRYWEQEFPQLKPVKRRGNRRYYQRQDVIIIRQIRSLLYEQGFTIGGARNKLGGEEARVRRQPEPADRQADAHGARRAAANPQALIPPLRAGRSLFDAPPGLRSASSRFHGRAGSNLSIASASFAVSGPEVLRIDHAIVTHDEGHDTGVAVLGGKCDGGEST